MTGAKWTIYWNEYSSNTYLYGSTIHYHAKDDVEFHNDLMPPGTIIKQWFSKTNFQMDKIEPALPMIDGESRYHISVHMDCAEQQRCFLRLVFYDRYEIEAGSVTIRDKEQDFQCPLKTYSYRMQLVNAGTSEFHFHSVVIQEIADESEE